MEDRVRRDQLLALFEKTVPSLVDPDDPQSQRDLCLFGRLFRQFLDEPYKVDWSRIRALPAEKHISHEHLPRAEGEEEMRSILGRLAVVKLNGGLGTTMGCRGPKSVLEVRDGLTFIDFAVRQHQVLQSMPGGEQVPLVLMNSFNTDSATQEYLRRKWPDQPVHCFSQSRCPRIFADTLLPVPNSREEEEGEEGWYPPGHGNVFLAMAQSGVLQRLLAQGRDVAFFANIDNTGAVLDASVAKLVADGRADYAMEMTPRTVADVKGGTLVEVDGGQRLMHLECPQVPADRVDEFCSLRTFTMFNTNNIWVNLRALEHRVEQMQMEILANQKCLSDGRRVLQLEQSIGGAIRNFPGRALAVCVPRTRFLPVKSTRDLLLLRSGDLFSLCPSTFVLRQCVPRLPEVHLSAEFAALAELERRIPHVPRMRNVRSIRLQGDVLLGRGVQMQGTVEICASPDGGQVRVPDNSIIGREGEQGAGNEQKHGEATPGGKAPN